MSFDIHNYFTDNFMTVKETKLKNSLIAFSSVESKFS